jgi:hypothetical protein
MTGKRKMAEKAKNSGSSSGEGTNQPSGEPAPQGGQGNEGAEAGSGTGALDFSDPNLKGKTPQEIENLFRTLRTTVREQGQALNQRSTEREGFQPTGRPADAPAPRGDDEQNRRYWNEPVAVLREEMERMIAPFRADVQATRATSVRQQLAQEFDDWNLLEPMVDAALAQAKMTPTAENLRGTYYSVKGCLVSTGQHPTGGAPAAPKAAADGGNGGGVPPQNRPSSAPMGTGGGQNKPKLRALTEDERLVARKAGLTDEQYLAFIELDEEQVVTSNIGRPSNG